MRILWYASFQNVYDFANLLILGKRLGKLHHPLSKIQQNPVTQRAMHERLHFNGDDYLEIRC